MAIYSPIISTSQTHIDTLMQDWSIYIANALEILQPCTKPYVCMHIIFKIPFRGGLQLRTKHIREWYMVTWCVPRVTTQNNCNAIKWCGIMFISIACKCHLIITQAFSILQFWKIVSCSSVVTQLTIAGNLSANPKSNHSVIHHALISRLDEPWLITCQKWHSPIQWYWSEISKSIECTIWNGYVINARN